MSGKLAHAGPGITDRALDERRKLGAYYTPERLSKILADWAIREPVDSILEPSFGGCGFLAAARDRLSAVGNHHPTRQIFGCDIDPVAFRYLASVFGGPTDATGFLLKDFLDCTAEPTWPDRFSVVLANPPYIPHHRIGKERVRVLARRSQPIDGVGGRSGLWAYFLSHSVGLLAPGGRMAWVLPGAFLQADYAKPIRSFLGERFNRCAAFLVRERLFLTEGTDEETVILLADGYRENAAAGRIEIGEATTLDALEEVIARWARHEWQGVTEGYSPAELSLPEDVRAIHANIVQRGGARTLGDIARVQIGLVTGDNRFFVLGREGLKSAGLTPSDCLAVLSKFKAATGLSLSGADLDAYADRGGGVFLVSTTEPEGSSPVTRYLATYDIDRRKKVSTFKKRKIWSATSDGNVPDAFFPVMHHTGPRLILNEDGANCTNTIHRIFFKSQVTTAQRRVAAISMLTTFSQLSAELVGRRYGSGVLKHEPRDAERIELLLPEADEKAVLLVATDIDQKLRAGEIQAARRAADIAIFDWASISLTKNAYAALEKTLDDMRTRRRPQRSVKPNGRSTSSPAPSIC